MALTKETTAATVKKYGAKENDTGSVKVQIALLTQRVTQLTDHVKRFPKDATAKRSLLKDSLFPQEVFLRGRHRSRLRSSYKDLP